MSRTPQNGKCFRLNMMFTITRTPSVGFIYFIYIDKRVLVEQGE